MSETRMIDNNYDNTDVDRIMITKVMMVRRQIRLKSMPKERSKPENNVVDKQVQKIKTKMHLPLPIWSVLYAL